MSRLFCNGQPADATLLGAVLVNYGHFTSLQVRNGAVQGWSLHLRRLQQATHELFDTPLDVAQLCVWLEDALAQCGMRDASVRITVFSREFDFRQPLRVVPVDVLVGITAPVTMPTTARAVMSLRYQRELPHIKHVGTFPLFHHRRHAMREGFDDVVFVDEAGKVSEGSTWNLAFWDGAQVVWPQAAALRGVTEQLLMAGLDRLGQRQAQRALELTALTGFAGAVACNASGLWPLAQIDGVSFAQSDLLLQLLRRALGEAPWERLQIGS
ncbi:aminotransferase class IV family protein [Stenotrophomonas sp. Iso1]|uniref:aminotransferase class IV family protein n=1 Tax=Stenotrophomonas sp. Iso1 TaxID=2977283 RepID=UPI0022B78D9A|nr:aminotransferase class IV family protein [Stenotrophomonas sp. Iso1]